MAATSFMILFKANIYVTKGENTMKTIMIILSLLSFSINAEPLPTIIVGGASMGNAWYPPMTKPNQGETPFSRSQSAPGYVALSDMMVKLVTNRYIVSNQAAAGTTSYDLPSFGYDAFGDGSTPFWPGLVKQFNLGMRGATYTNANGKTATLAKVWIVTLPDDCYYQVDAARPGCVSGMIANTQASVSAAKSRKVPVIVFLQPSLDNVVDLSLVPGAITPAQWQAQKEAWDSAFEGRETERVYTIDFYANVDPYIDTRDGIHLTYPAMQRAAKRVLAIVDRL